MFRTFVLMTFSINFAWYPITCFRRSVVCFISSVVLRIRIVNRFSQSVVRMNFSISCTHDFFDYLCLIFDYFSLISHHFLHSISFVFQVIIAAWYSIGCMFYSSSCAHDFFDQFCLIFYQFDACFLGSVVRVSFWISYVCYEWTALFYM